MKLRNIIAVLGVIVTGLLFFYAGIGKTENPSAFFFVLEEYHLNWPLGYIYLVTAILPAVEIGLGLAILVNLVISHRFYRYLTLGTGVALLSVFIAFMLWALAHGDLFGCGCFGDFGSRLSWWDVLRDGIFILLALAGFLAPTRPIYCRSEASVVKQFKEGE
jgi:uncharacterized membrane protein YphA (DoxX/SURF4 family)